MKKDLTGLERELVLEYLAGGTAPLTLSECAVRAVPSGAAEKTVFAGAFPVALRGGQFRVLGTGGMLIESPPPSVSRLVGKRVRVQFQFNTVALCFDTELTETKAGISFAVPAAIRYAEDAPKAGTGGVSVVVHCGTADLACTAEPGYVLFSPPAWDDIPAGDRAAAKAYLAQAAQSLRESREPVDGARFLLPICRFLAEGAGGERAPAPSRAGAPSVIYIDGARMVFAARAAGMALQERGEYDVLLSFPLPFPLKERQVRATCRVSHVFRDSARTRCCAVARFVAIKGEDVRFLSERRAD